MCKVDHSELIFYFVCVNAVHMKCLQWTLP